MSSDSQGLLVRIKSLGLCKNSVLIIHCCNSFLCKALSLSICLGSFGLESARSGEKGPEKMGMSIFIDCLIFIEHLLYEGPDLWCLCLSCYTKIPTNLVSGEGHMVEEAGDFPWVAFYRGTNPICES